MKKLFKNVNFRLIFIGNFVSNLGSLFYNFAISWFILDITGSALQAGIYMTVGSVTSLIFTPISGVITDRFNKVRIVYITDFIRGLAILAAGFAVFSGLSDSMTMIVLYSATIVLAINGSLFSPAVESLRAEIVDRDDLQAANATMSTLANLRWIIGLLLGGVIYVALGVYWIFIINGLSFIFSGISEMFIKHPFKKKEGKLTFKTGYGDFREGLKYLMDKRGILALMIGTLFLNFAFIPLFANGMPYLYNQILEKTAVDYAVIEIAIAVGSIISGLFIGNVSKTLNVRKTTLGGLSVMTVCFTIITIAVHWVIYGQLNYYAFLGIMVSILLIHGFAHMYVNIPIQTAFIKAIDQEYLGRAFSVLTVLASAAIPLATFIGGVLIEYGSIQLLLIEGLVVLVLIMIYIFTNKNIRHFFKSVQEMEEVESGE